MSASRLMKRGILKGIPLSLFSLSANNCARLTFFRPSKPDSHNMKHFTFLLAAMLVLATSLQAQRLTDVHTFAQIPSELSDAEAQMMRNAGHESALEVAQRGGGTILFYEDFAE